MLHSRPWFGGQGWSYFPLYFFQDCNTCVQILRWMIPAPGPSLQKSIYYTSLPSASPSQNLLISTLLVLCSLTKIPPKPRTNLLLNCRSILFKILNTKHNVRAKIVENKTMKGCKLCSYLNKLRFIQSRPGLQFIMSFISPQRVNLKLTEIDLRVQTKNNTQKYNSTRVNSNKTEMPDTIMVQWLRWTWY